MPRSFYKFSPTTRCSFARSLKNLREEGISSARSSVQYLRPGIRAPLIRLAAGECIHPEILLINLGTIVKALSLRATVYTIPTKDTGLRIQSSSVLFADPGMGKGNGQNWQDEILKPLEDICRDYISSELQASLPNDDRPRFTDENNRSCIGHLKLPGRIQLPNGSCEAVLMSASYIPVLEYVKDKQTIVDKSGGNGMFLASHDSTLKAFVYKAAKSVPAIPQNNVFWQISINLQDALDWIKVGACNGTTRRVVYSYADDT